jgi:hypothetical protein
MDVALTANKDDAAATVSPGSGGRICVKVINHFGDEVQKIFSV